MGTTHNSATLEELATRLQELEQELVTLRATQATGSTQPAMAATQAHEKGQHVPETRTTSRRHMLRAALGTATAAVAAGAAGLSLEQGSASANTGDNMILGQTNLANSGTQVKWNGSSGFTGVILLGNDSGFSDSGAFFPAAAGGWAGGGAAGVPHGVYGFTQVAPTSTLTPTGVAGVATLGTGVHGATQSTSITSLGVEGISPHGIGVSGTSTNGTGVSGTGGSSSPGTGVAGTGDTGVRGTGVTTGVAASATGPSGVGVSASGPSIGVVGTSTHTGVEGLAFGAAGVGVSGNSSGAGGQGVLGISGNAGDGVLGRSTNPSAPGNGVHATAAGVTPTAGAFGAVFAEGGTHTGVFATSTTGAGVQGSSGTGIGVTGSTGSTAANAIAIFGTISSVAPGLNATAVRGQNNGTSANGIGVYGTQNGSGIGVCGGTPGGVGVRGVSTTGTGVLGISSTGRGGIFTGSSAAIQLTPSTASTHPATGAAGDLFVDAGHNLWFCKGGSSWIKLA